MVKQLQVGLRSYLLSPRKRVRIPFHPEGVSPAGLKLFGNAELGCRHSQEERDGTLQDADQGLGCCPAAGLLGAGGPGSNPQHKEKEKKPQNKK